LTVYSEDDLLPLSGLQHLEFCERQWALIHIEQVWEESALTAEGRVLHERVDTPKQESRVDVLVCRGVTIWSRRLGLSGRADVVEFHRAREAEAERATVLPGREGWWLPFPVEYKRGRPKAGHCDEVQLCAQAMCLEERFGVRIGEGALFYGRTRHREVVAFSGSLRERTEALSARMHEMYRLGETPPPVYSERCEKCSLRERCMPRALEKPGPVARYLARALREDG
jgi:CRISPR-associated exonuclease Cas4